MRRGYIVWIVLGVIVFLVISALLARVFSVDGAERAAIASLVQSEARGDAAGVVSRIDGCAADASCRSEAAANASALKHPGSISILTLDPSAGFSLTSTVGYARVAWTAGTSLPNVQCVRVRRAGNVLSGLRVELLSVTPKLPGDSTCP